MAIVISWLIFRNPINALNAVGCSITLLGCTFYGYVRHKLSEAAKTTGFQALEKSDDIVSEKL